MRKLNRSKLLGLVTAGAIVVTTAFSFAAWDKLTSEKVSGTVTVRNPVTITAGTLQNFTPTETLGELPSYETSVEYTLAEASGKNLYFYPTVSVTDGTNPINASYYTITKSNDGAAITNQTSIDCTVTVTPTEVGAASLGGKTITVEVTGELSTIAPTP